MNKIAIATLAALLMVGTNAKSIKSALAQTEAKVETDAQVSKARVPLGTLSSKTYGGFLDIAYGADDVIFALSA